MAMMIADIAAVFLLSVAVPSVVPVDNSGPMACLSAEDMRAAVAEGRVMQPAEASRHARHAAPGEVVRISLCRQGDDFIYVVTTLKGDGRVARVTLEGQSGKVSAIR